MIEILFGRLAQNRAKSEDKQIPDGYPADPVAYFGLYTEVKRQDTGKKKQPRVRYQGMMPESYFGLPPHV